MSTYIEQDMSTYIEQDIFVDSFDREMGPAKNQGPMKLRVRGFDLVEAYEPDFFGSNGFVMVVKRSLQAIKEMDSTMASAVGSATLFRDGWQGMRLLREMLREVRDALPEREELVSMSVWRDKKVIEGHFEYCDRCGAEEGWVPEQTIIKWRVYGTTNWGRDLETRLTDNQYQGLREQYGLPDGIFSISLTGDPPISTIREKYPHFPDPSVLCNYLLLGRA